MKEITCRQITETVEALCIRANIVLPDSLKQAIQKGKETERSALGLEFLHKMEENYRLAEEKKLPVCQDTGIAVVFCEVGQDVRITGGSFEEAIHQGVRQGYLRGYLRLSVVADPLKRVNTDDNTPAVVYTRIVPGEHIKITVAPKGAGSENMSALKMFTPSADREEIMEFIVHAVDTAGGNPCPPVIVGVGLGGTAEKAMLLAKEALLRPVGQPAAESDYAGMERELLRRINCLGLGPQGLGGALTAFAVHIEAYPTHIACLPCAVNLGCSVTRHAGAVL